MQICIWPPSDQPIWGPWQLRESSDQKISKDKKFLELNFREGIFYAKILKDPQFWGSPRAPSDQKVASHKIILEFNYEGRGREIQNSAPQTIRPQKVSKKVSHPCRTNTACFWFSRNRLFSALSHTLKVGWSDPPPPKNYSHGVVKALKILSRSFHSIKNYSTCLKNSRLTDTCPPIH
jgi:hypothetical protein